MLSRFARIAGGADPRFAARNVSMSLTVDRNAPAPASVGRSQLGVTSPRAVCPTDMRDLMPAGSVMAVSFIRSGPSTRSTSAAS